jgi:hypothetical protein
VFKAKLEGFLPAFGRLTRESTHLAGKNHETTFKGKVLQAKGDTWRKIQVLTQSGNRRR